MLFASICLGALAASPNLEVDSRTQMKLELRGEFALAQPGKPLRFKVAGPGRFVAYLVPDGRKGEDQLPIQLEARADGKSIYTETLTAQRIPGLALQSGRGTFVPGGIKRVTFDLLPKSHVYELRVGGPTAISAAHIVQAPPGIKVPEVPVSPEGRAPLLTFAAKEPWHWASICDHVTVSVPGSGTLQIHARTELSPTGDLPPPTFLRAVSDGKVRAASPITAAPELGLEFALGRSRFGAGTLRTMTLPVPAAGDYEFELTAWGCINGVGLQFEFQPGPVAVAQTETPPAGGTAPPTTPATPPTSSAAPLEVPLPVLDGGTQYAQLTAQCGLLLDDVGRARAIEYLDTMVASGIIPPSIVVLHQSTEVGASFLIQNVAYILDGNPLFKSDSPSVSTGPLAERKVVPGPHTLDVKVTLRGQGSGPFSYLNEYVLHVSKREAFVAEAGKTYDLKVALADKGFTVPFKERPMVKVEVAPVAQP